MFAFIQKAGRGKRRRAAGLPRRLRSVTASKSGSGKRPGYSFCVATPRIKYVAAELGSLYFCSASGLWHAASAAVSPGFGIISAAPYKCPFSPAGKDILPRGSISRTYE